MAPRQADTARATVRNGAAAEPAPASEPCGETKNAAGLRDSSSFRRMRMCLPVVALTM